MHILFCSITATNLGQFSKPGTELKSAGPDFFKAPPYTSNLTNFMLRYLGLETHDRGRFHHDIPILIIDWSPKDISLEVKTLVSLQLLITQGYRHRGICLYHSFIFMLIYLTEGKTIEIWTICVKSNWLDIPDLLIVFIRIILADICTFDDMTFQLNKFHSWKYTFLYSQGTFSV